MPKRTFIFCLIIFSSLLSGQETLQETSMVVNIEVPVRVFGGDAFINNLTIDDFELFEDGILQKIEAVYLIKKDTIQKKEERKKYKPETFRTFYLFFEVSEYNPKLERSIDYFVKDVLLPTDSLVIVSPLKTYKLKNEGLKLKSREQIADELKSLIRKDAVMGNSEYRSAVKDLENITKALIAKLVGPTAEPGSKLNPQNTYSIMSYTGLELEELLTLYAGLLQKLEVLRQVDELKIMDFAKYLKQAEGQKTVFLFYQREYIPQIEPRILNQVMSAYQNYDGVDISHFTADAFDFSTRDHLLNVDKVKKAFSDASTSIHFLYLTTPREYVPGIYFAERSNDIFAPFLEMAKASGGFADSSSNPEYLMTRAVEANDNYYLLYYSPKKYGWDGKFKNIKVNVKGKNYKVVHRMGYFAN